MVLAKAKKVKENKSYAESPKTIGKRCLASVDKALNVCLKSANET